MTGQDTKKICNLRFLINGHNINYTNALVLLLSDNLISFIDYKTGQTITYNTSFLISCQEVNNKQQGGI